MKYIDYKEHKEQGTFNFPIAFYHETPNSPRYNMPYHWHTHYEIIRVISGTLHLTIDDSNHEYKQGDVVFITDGMLHGGTPQNCIYECIVFDLHMLLKENNVCSKILYDILNHNIAIPVYLSSRSEAILPIIRNLSLSLSSRKKGFEFFVLSYLYQLVGIILEEHLYEDAKKSISTERLNSIKDVLTYISDNYYSNISLEQLAKIAGMNPKYFCRYFRSVTERTPIDYLNYFRIESACEMLSSKDISIKEVAISCGFNDESYFIKTFYKYKNITPKQFVKKEF